MSCWRGFGGCVYCMFFGSTIRVGMRMCSAGSIDQELTGHRSRLAAAATSSHLTSPHLIPSAPTGARFRFLLTLPAFPPGESVFVLFSLFFAGFRPPLRAMIALFRATREVGRQSALTSNLSEKA